MRKKARPCWAIRVGASATTRCRVSVGRSCSSVSGGSNHSERAAAAPGLLGVSRRYGLFRRSITLPRHVQAEAIEASTEDGVLQVVVPKVEEAKPRRIEVRAVRALASTTLDAPGSAPTDEERGAAGRGGGVEAMREHGHVDSAFV